MTHLLKILPIYFEAVISDKKRFEIRNNKDRGFQVGDTVKLMEWDASTELMTGRWVTVCITYVTNFEQRRNFVVFGFDFVLSNIKAKGVKS